MLFCFLLFLQRKKRVNHFMTMRPSNHPKLLSLMAAAAVAIYVYEPGTDLRLGAPESSFAAVGGP